MPFKQNPPTKVSVHQAPAPAADSPEKKGAVTNKDLKARFQRLVGAEAFISESKLKSIKTVGSGSFATGTSYCCSQQCKLSCTPAYDCAACYPMMDSEAELQPDCLSQVQIKAGAAMH